MKRLAPVRLDPELLHADESPTDHACARIDLYRGDLALLNYLLQDVRALARQAADRAIDIEPYRAIEWKVHGLQRRTLVCDPDRLVDHSDVLVVGFFGDRRASPEAAAVDVTELAVIAELANHPGIVSYSSIELVGDQWANLVLHRQASDRDDWRHSQVHVAAAEDLAPLVYHSVRIHNGWVAGGPIGSATVTLDSTKYWDYDCQPAWHAFRSLTTSQEYAP